MRTRVDKLGVSEPEIRKQGNDQIVIELAGVKDPKQALEIIGKTAQLELFDLEAEPARAAAVNAGLRRPDASRSTTCSPAQQAIRRARRHADRYYLFDKKKKLIAGPDRHATSS